MALKPTNCTSHLRRRFFCAVPSYVTLHWRSPSYIVALICLQVVWMETTSQKEGAATPVKATTSRADDAACRFDI